MSLLEDLISSGEQIQHIKIKDINGIYCFILRFIINLFIIFWINWMNISSMKCQKIVKNSESDWIILKGIQLISML